MSPVLVTLFVLVVTCEPPDSDSGEQGLNVSMGEGWKVVDSVLDGVWIESGVRAVTE
jgi:hypothetical protein